MGDGDSGGARWRRVDPWVPAWVAVTASVLALRGFLNTISRDSAFYLYAGQEVVAGHAPYEAVMNRAGPLAHLLPALGVVTGRTLGLGDVGGTRALFFVMAIAVPALVYVMVRRATGSRLAGSFGAGSMLCIHGFTTFAAYAPGSKSPMVLLLLVAMLLLQRRRMTAAGIATGLATLTWQPVLFVALPAGLVIAALGHRGLRARVLAAVRFGLGGMLTLALTVVGFAAAGALDAFVDGFWTANFRYTTQPGALDGPGRVWELVVRANGWTASIVVLGCVAALLIGVWSLRRPVRADGAALGAAAAGGIAWSLVAFNGPPDAFVLFPAAACGMGGAAGLVLHQASARPRVRHATRAAVAACVAIAVVATTHFTTTSRTTGLIEPRADARALFDALPADSTAFSVEAPQALALANERSISRYVLFGNGMLPYIDGEFDGGLQGYRRWLRDEEPTVVLTPTGGISVRFLRPLMRDYVPVGESSGWDAYLREDVPLDTRARVMAALASA